VRVVAIALVLFVTAGCAGGDHDGGQESATEAAATAPTRTSAGTQPATAETSATTRLRVYFVRGDRVGVATRDVPRTQAVAAAAVRELLRGADDVERAGGLRTAIPEGTELRGVSIANGVATVDLSREFESAGGSASTLLRVAQVVHTLTQFPTVRRVAFRIEGADVAAIGGEGVVVSPPVDRGEFEDQAPAILVESVGPGDEVSSPLRVTGTANTFEATFMLRVNQGGRTLVDRFFTATSGSGTRGTFDVTLTFARDAAGPSPGTLVAYERSAEDGSQIHTVVIPVRFRD